MELKENTKLKLDIRKQGINGEGIGYYNRMAIFVPGAIRKEVVNVEIEEVFDRYAKAKLIDIIRPSKKRVKPQCKYYETCGHCHLQHIEYNEQLKNKKLILEQSIKRFSSVETIKNKVDYTLNSREPYGYKRQATFILRNSNLGLTMGFFNPITNHFVSVEECKVLDQEINQIAGLALKLFRKYKVKAYDRRNREGHLFDLVIRYFKNTDAASVVMTVSEPFAKLNDIANELIDTFQSIQSVGYAIYNRESHVTLFNPVETLAGEEKIPVMYHDDTIKISPKGIFPDNKEVFEMMDEIIVKETGLSKNDLLLNCYQYSTLSSLFLSKYANQVIAIDYDSDSIQDGIDNQKTLKINNIQWLEDHVESVLNAKLDSPISIMNVYAPKNGLGFNVINLIKEKGPDQLVYISENPSMMARDIDRLSSQYQIMKVIPVDMNPQNASIYSMIFLDRQ